MAGASNKPTRGYIVVSLRAQALDFESHYNLGMTGTMMKGQVKQLIIQNFIDEEIFAEDTIVPTEQGAINGEELKHLEL